MRICFFTGDITWSGGTERIVSTLTDGLLQNYPQFEMTILSLEHEQSTPFYPFAESITLKSLQIPDSLTGIQKFFVVTRRLRKFIKRNEIDILVDVDTLLSLYSVPALWFTKTKHISWEHFTFQQDLGFKFRNWGRKLAGRFADSIVVLTKNDQRQYLASGSIKRPVKHIYNPIVLNNHELPEDKEESKTILSAGRLTYQKGFDILIDVAELVFQKHPDWKWLVVGEGEDRAKLDEKVREKKLENHVLFPGLVNNIEEYYKRAEMFVLTSRFEPFGLVLTEAKSFYLPCISFDVDSGPGEIILDDINGYLIKPFDVKAMADKIIYLIEQPEIRKHQAANAMKDTEKFALDTISEQWTKLFQTLA